MITKAQIRAGLGLLDMTVAEFTSETRVKKGTVPSKNAINTFLRSEGKSMHSRNLEKIEREFSRLGIQFTDQGGVNPPRGTEK